MLGLLVLLVKCILYALLTFSGLLVIPVQPLPLLVLLGMLQHPVSLLFKVLELFKFVILLGFAPAHNSPMPLQLVLLMALVLLVSTLLAVILLLFPVILALSLNVIAPALAPLPFTI